MKTELSVYSVAIYFSMIQPIFSDAFGLLPIDITGTNMYPIALFVLFAIKGLILKKRRLVMNFRLKFPHGLETENNECKRWLYNMGIYITGDLHGEIDIKKLSFNNWPESRDLTREDVLIITGDFGLPFWPTETFTLNNDIRQYEKDDNKIYHYWI